MKPEIWMIRRSPLVYSAASRLLVRTRRATTPFKFLMFCAGDTRASLTAVVNLLSIELGAFYAAAAAALLFYAVYPGLKLAKFEASLLNQLAFCG